MRLPGSASLLSMVLTLGLFLGTAWSTEPEAQWIWTPNPTGLLGPSKSCHFRKAFQVSSVRQGHVVVATPGRYELYVNGRRIASGTSTDPWERHEVSTFLNRGRNLVAIRVDQTQDVAMALAARIEIVDAAGHKHVFLSDNTWVTNARPLPFWYTPLYNDGRWEAAEQLGAWRFESAKDEQILADHEGDSIPSAARRTVLDSQRSTASRREVDGDNQAATPAEVVEARLPAGGSHVSDQATEPPSADLFRVPIDFAVERLLDHQATGSLIAMTFNEFGHVIAAREGGGLLLIHDSNGDGRPNSVRPYSDQVQDCHGLLCLNGYVFVTGDGPDGRGLYRLRDESRDGQADQVKLLLELPAESSDAGPNSLTLGTDGLLYVVVGYRTELPSQVVPDGPYRNSCEDHLLEPRFDVPGQDHEPAQTFAGAVLRMDIDAKRIEILAGGLRNAQALAFDREGQLFTFDGDHQADLGAPWYQPASLYHVTAGAEFGWRPVCARWPDYYPDRIAAVIETGRETPSSMVFYHHYEFPTPYHDALFVADRLNGQITVFTFEAAGASYSVGRAVFLEHDVKRIRGLDVGPDGHLYFVTGNGDDSGGLYRVTWEGPPTPGSTDWGQGLDAVIRYPQMNSAWARQRVATLKNELGDDWDQLLPAVAASAANPWQYRVRALDLLQLYGPTPPATLLIRMAQDADPRVRSKAAQWMGLHADEKSHTMLVHLLADEDARVRRQACEALLQVGYRPPVDALIPLLQSDDAVETLAARRLLGSLPPDSWRDRLLASDDHRLLIQSSLALMTADPTPEHARVVLDKAGATMATFMTDQDFLGLLRVVQVALVKGRIPLTELQPLRAQLAAEFPATDTSMNRELVRLVAYLQIPDMQERAMEWIDDEHVPGTDKLDLAFHVGLLVGDWNPEQQMRLLDFFQQIRDWPGGAAFSAYARQATDEFVQSMSVEDLRRALTHGDRWPEAAFALLHQLPEQLDAEMLEALKQLDRKIIHLLDPEIFRLKVGIVAVLARSGDRASMHYLRELWQQDPERRLAVAMGLAQHPSEENWPYLIRSLSVLEGEAAEDALVQLRSIALAPEAPNAYRHVILHGMSLGDPGAEAAVALLEFWTGQQMEVDDDAADVADQLAAWQTWYAEQWPEAPEAELPDYRLHGVWDHRELARFLTLGEGRGGSAKQGQEVFHRANCAQCHRVGNVGGDLGPDLTTLGRRAMRKEVLQAILFPSAEIAADYARHTVITRQGRSLSGRLVLPDDADSLMLKQLDNRAISLSHSDIVQILPERVSIMPEGTLDQLTLQEIADLFAFLFGEREQRFVDRQEAALQR